MGTDINKKEMFVQRRAEGWSYDKISKEIGVSKPTLIKWGKADVENIRKAAKNIQEGFLKDIRNQVNVRKEKLLNIMNAGYKSLAEIDYEELSEKELINLIIRLEAKLKEYIEMTIGEEPEEKVINILRGGYYKGENERKERAGQGSEL